jgi:CheY-like chemotaxis protein
VTSFDALLGELREQYRLAAPERLQVMRRALEALSGDPAHAVALDELRFSFHAFAGNGRTYGFPDVTRLGLEGDAQCAARQRAGPPQPAELEGWRVLVDAIEAALRSHPAPEPMPASGTATPVARAERVLSVDDDPHQCAYLRAVLASAGYDVRTCLDPAQFLQAHRAFDPDLVVMDVVLPGTSGYQLARALRERAPQVPVVFLTTTEPEGELPEAAELLRKPVEPGALLGAVRRQLARRSARPE